MGVVKNQLNCQLSLSTMWLSGIATQVIRLDSKYLYPLSNLSGQIYLISVNLNIGSHM